MNELIVCAERLLHVFGDQALPKDPDALRRFAADLQTELARKDIEITERDAEIHAETRHTKKLKMRRVVTVRPFPRETRPRD